MAQGETCEHVWPCDHLRCVQTSGFVFHSSRRREIKQTMFQQDSVKLLLAYV